MEAVKKMVLVDPRLITKETHEPTEIREQYKDLLKRHTTLQDKTLSALDHQMNDILNDDAVSPDERIKLYQNCVVTKINMIYGH